MKILTTRKFPKMKVYHERIFERKNSASRKFQKQQNFSKKNGISIMIEFFKMRFQEEENFPIRSFTKERILRRIQQ